MFINEKIEANQQWKNEELCFEPDSSPKAWEHYNKYYLKTDSRWCIRNNYNFDNLFFYNKYDKVGLKKGFYRDRVWYNYTNSPLRDDRYNRLFALENNTKTIEYNNVDYCESAYRFGGECDFNFSEKKCMVFRKIIDNNQSILEQLEKCKDNHHRLVNFSLIQAMGNMQGIKGSNRFDRFDTFIYHLSRYFSGLSNEIISTFSNPNKQLLIDFLGNFISVYDYCEAIYFIDDRKFIDKIIQQGNLPIKECKDVVRYMNLAEEFWNKKEFHFLKKEFLKVGDYFMNGGETYTIDELLIKIENDLGCDEDEAKYLIKKCVERGFIQESGNGIYTR